MTERSLTLTPRGVGTPRTNVEAALVHELSSHAEYREPPGSEAEDHDRADVREVGQALPAEHRVAHQLDAVVERVQLCAICAHSGSPSIGKNVPATRNSGVMIPLVT